MFVFTKMMIRMLEEIGGNIYSRSSRDNIFCTVDTLRYNVEKCVRMFSESIMRPLLEDSEIKELSVQNLWNKPMYRITCNMKMKTI